MQSSKSLTAKLIWFIFGIIFLLLGLVGILFPIIPGFLFLIPAFYCFAKASSKIHDVLKRNRFIGKYFL